MAKLVLGSPSLTQPLLYPSLGPAILDKIGGVIYAKEGKEKNA
jgi:hypothetical protein